MDDLTLTSKCKDLHFDIFSIRRIKRKIKPMHDMVIRMNRCCSFLIIVFHHYASFPSN